MPGMRKRADRSPLNKGAANKKSTTKPKPQRKAAVSPANVTDPASSTDGTTPNNTIPLSSAVDDSETDWNADQFAVANDSDDEEHIHAEDNDAPEDDEQDGEQYEQEVEMEEGDAPVPSVETEGNAGEAYAAPEYEEYADTACDSDDDMFEANYQPVSRRLMKALMEDLELLDDYQYATAFEIVKDLCPIPHSTEWPPRLPIPNDTVRALVGLVNGITEAYDHVDAEDPELAALRQPDVTRREMERILRSWNNFNPWLQCQFIEMMSLHIPIDPAQDLELENLPQVMLRLLLRHVNLRIGFIEEPCTSSDATMERAIDGEVSGLEAPIVMTADVPTAPIPPILNDNAGAQEKQTNGTVAEIDALINGHTTIEKKQADDTSDAPNVSNKLGNQIVVEKQLNNNKRKRDEVEQEDQDEQGEPKELEENDHERPPKKRIDTGTLPKLLTKSSEDVSNQVTDSNAAKEPSAHFTAPGMKTGSHDGEAPPIATPISKKNTESHSQEDVSAINKPKPVPIFTNDNVAPPEPKITRGGVKPPAPIADPVPQPTSNAEKEELISTAPKQARVANNKPSANDSGPETSPEPNNEVTAPKRTRGRAKRAPTTSESENKQTTENEGPKKRSTKKDDADAAPNTSTNSSAEKTTKTGGQKKRGAAKSAPKASDTKKEATDATPAVATKKSATKQTTETQSQEKPGNNKSAPAKPASEGGKGIVDAPTTTTNKPANKKATIAQAQKKNTSAQPPPVTAKNDATVDSVSANATEKTTKPKPRKKRARSAASEEGADGAEQTQATKRVKTAAPTATRNTTRRAPAPARTTTRQTERQQPARVSRNTQRQRARRAAADDEADEAARVARRERIAAPMTTRGSTRSVAAPVRAANVDGQVQLQQDTVLPPAQRKRTRETTADEDTDDDEPLAKRARAAATTITRDGTNNATSRASPDNKAEEDKVESKPQQKTASPKTISNSTNPASDSTEKLTTKSAARHTAAQKKRGTKSGVAGEKADEVNKPERSNETAALPATGARNGRAVADTIQTTEAPRPNKRSREATSVEESEEEEHPAPKKTKISPSANNEETDKAEDNEADKVTDQSASTENVAATEGTANGEETSTNSNGERPKPADSSPRRRGVARPVDPQVRERERKRKERDAARKAAQQDRNNDARKFFDKDQL